MLNIDNPLFTLARSGQRLTHPLIAIILSFVFILVAQLIGGIPAVLINVGLSLPTLDAGAPPADQAALLQLLMPDTALEQAVFLVLVFGPVFLLLWGWLRLFEKRPFWTLGLGAPGALRQYARGWLVGLLMFGAAVVLMALLGFATFEGGVPPALPSLATLGGVLLVLLGWLVQGPAEEALTRGWLMPVIGARWKPALGVLLSSLVFAVLHSLNPNLNPIAILNLFLFGVFTAFYALREGSLWGVFSIHTVWNWTQGNLLGFEVSGQAPVGGILLDLQEVGPDVVTGGPFGPEGGLAVTLVLLTSCALLWLAGRRRETP